MTYHAKTTKELTREYFDSLVLEMRLMDSAVPDTSFELFGKSFKTPIMTAALSHLGTFNPDIPSGMVQYAMGAQMSGAVHWVGMGSDEEYAAIAATGAQCIRIVKPYADEEKIFSMIRFAEEHDALAVGMDIDHMFGLDGEDDLCMGEQMKVKSSADIKRYVEATKLPFVVKGVLSVHDALKCLEAGVKGIVVSTHGGRLNGTMPPLMILPEIVKAVGGKMKIFVDCGVCSGMDAYKALALGADAVGVGIHLISYIKKGGEQAVADRINEMTTELKGAMAYTGVKNVNEFDASVVHRI